MNKYEVYYSKGWFNCSTNQLSSLVYRCHATVEAADKRDAVNAVLDDLAEEHRMQNMTLTVHQDSPTYRGWEAYARFNELHRVLYGQMLTSERIIIYDDFKVMLKNQKEKKA